MIQLMLRYVLSIFPCTIISGNPPQVNVLESPGVIAWRQAKGGALAAGRSAGVLLAGFSFRFWDFIDAVADRPTSGMDSSGFLVPL